jgi:hypothetical protein
MISRRWLVLLGTSISVVVTAVWAFSSQRSAPLLPKPPGELADEVSALREEVAQLRMLSARAAIERAPSSARRPDNPAADHEKERKETQPPSRPSTERMAEIRRRSMELQERRHESLEALLTSERRNDEWATSTEREIRDVLAGSEFAGNAVERVECRSSLCRIAVSHADLGGEQSFATLFASRVLQLPDALFFRSVDSQGKASTIAFFSRDTASFAAVSGNHLLSGAPLP